MKTIWLDWNDLTPKEQEQARLSYVGLRADESQIPEGEVNADDVVTALRFERLPDGYIYVDL